MASSRPPSPSVSYRRTTQAELEDVVERAHRRASGEAIGDIRISLLIRHNSLLSMEMLDRFLAPYHLNAIGYFVMMALESKHSGCANPSELADRMGETRTNMTRIADELVRQKLVRRVTNPEDRRRIDLSLTDKGEALLQVIVPALHERAKRMFAGLGAEEKATLIRILTKLNQTYENLTAEDL